MTRINMGESVRARLHNQSKQVMWNTFLKRNKLPEKALPVVIKILRQKLQPILNAAAAA